MACRAALIDLAPYPMPAVCGHLWGSPHERQAKRCDAMGQAVRCVVGVARCSCSHPVTVRLGYRSVALIWCENANPGKCICESAISCPSYAAQGYALALEGGNNGRGCSSAMGICARAWRALRAVDRAWRDGVAGEKNA